MLTFYHWLEQLTEERRRAVAPEVLKSYDLALLLKLEKIATGIPDSQLRAKFLTMLRCPIVDSRGHCRYPAEYVLAALEKNGIHNRFDIEAAVQYVFEKMLLPKAGGEEEGANIFAGFDPTRPDSVEHFRARFMSYVKFAVGNIKKGKIRRLSNVQQRPAGTISIGQGRQPEGEPGGTISPEEIADRRSDQGKYKEMIADITTLLRRKEPAYGLPLAALFAAIIAGNSTQQQRAKFGDRITRIGRQIIVRTMEEFAQTTNNYTLLNLLTRFKQGQPASPSRQPAKVVKPMLSPKERDYQSILQVIDRHQGQPVGSGILGSYRRRWLGYPARTPGSTQNRLDDTLAQMVRDGVLGTVKGSQGGVMYVPGPAADQYRQAAGV